MWSDLEQIVSRTMREAVSSPKPPPRKERDLLEEVLGLSRLMAGQQNDALNRLIKLLEASIPNQAMVNALLGLAKPTGPAGPGSLTGLWHQQPPRSTGILGDVQKATRNSE
jgi:hypothetical protein